MKRPDSIIKECREDIINYKILNHDGVLNLLDYIDYLETIVDNLHPDDIADCEVCGYPLFPLGRFADDKECYKCEDNEEEK